MTVRIYRSSDYGHPVLTGTAGDLLKVLDACLVTGYGVNPITSLTQAAGVATATCTSPHGMPLGAFAMRQISGANEAGFNVEALAMSTGTYTFTYPVNPLTPATGTGPATVKCAGSGWSKPFPNVGSVGAYRQPTTFANGRYLRVDDVSVANTARVVGYVSMADLNSGSGAFPTNEQVPGGLYMYKSDSSDSVERDWILYCNGAIFYLIIRTGTTWSTTQGTAFGDFEPSEAGDVFNTILIASPSTGPSSSFATLTGSLNNSGSAHYIARSHSQLGTSVYANKGGDYYKSFGQASLGGGGMTYPAPTDGGLYVSPVWVGEVPVLSAGSVVRGRMPGLYSPLHFKPLANGDIWVPTGDLVGKTFEARDLHSSAQGLFEISDTW